jgi:hypothetical protein
LFLPPALLLLTLSPALLFCPQGYVKDFPAMAAFLVRFPDTPATKRARLHYRNRNVYYL